MDGLPRLAQAYIVALGALAVAAALYAIPYLPLTFDGVLSVAFFTAAACGAQVFHIFLPRVSGAYFTIATACNISVAVLFGPAAVLWTALVSSALATIILRRPLSRVIFNPSQLSLAFGAAALAYRSLWDGPPLANLLPALLAVITLGIVYFLLNTGCVFLIVSLVDRVPFPRLWRLSAKRIFLHDIVMVAVGLTFSILWSYSHWSAPLIFPLVLSLYQSMAALGKMQEQTKAALLELASVIDRRDCQTFAHSERVADYVGWICDELRLPGDEKVVIVYAARLHDLGKVGVPDGLLLKPAKLTVEEETLFRRHPDTGADIIAKFPIFREGTDIVRHEHEWYDGKGYPQGLRGEAIPYGSRIIAVADAYEAMTSDRSYRKALPAEVAIGRLLSGAGSQFDPVIVQVFLRTLEKHEHVAVDREQVDAMPVAAWPGRQTVDQSSVRA